MEDDGLEPRDAIYAMFIPPEWEEHYIGAMDTPSQWLAQEAQKAEESQPLEDMVPVQYHNFRDVFSKEAFDEPHHRRHGTMPLTLHLGLSSLTPGHSPCPLQNRRSSMTSSTRTS